MLIDDSLLVCMNTIFAVISIFCIHNHKLQKLNKNFKQNTKYNLKKSY